MIQRHMNTNVIWLKYSKVFQKSVDSNNDVSDIMLMFN